MVKNKTTETTVSVEGFLKGVSDDSKRSDCLEIIEILKKTTGLNPKMWGPSIIGFGSHHYKYESGREGDSPNIAFSPRASTIAIYLSANFDDRDALLEKFGRYKSDKGCVHIRSLADIDREILKKMVTNHIKHIKKLYPNR